MKEFTERAAELIIAVPAGMVCTYGGIAVLAGNPKAARQVVRILNSLSRSLNLPWHRIVNAQGKISLREGYGFEEQKIRLEKEGVIVGKGGTIDLGKYLWRGISDEKERNENPA